MYLDWSEVWDILEKRSHGKMKALLYCSKSVRLSKPQDKLISRDGAGCQNWASFQSDFPVQDISVI